MRNLPFVLVFCAFGLPAAAEVTHNYEGRFGVAYQSDAAPGQSRTRPLYEGRYTSTFTQRSDNGLTFRFELDVIVGNMPERGARHRQAAGQISVGTDRN